MTTFREEVAEFAAKAERIPKELREMSGVPSDIKKQTRVSNAEDQLEVLVKSGCSLLDNYNCIVNASEVD